MRAITIIGLGASVTLGLAAILVAKVALPAQAATRPAALPAPPRNAVSVVVAAQDIAYGQKLDPHLLRLAKLPPDAAPQGAFSSIEAVIGADANAAPVALAAIAAREPVLPSKLSGPGARPSVAAALAPGMRAFTISVSAVLGVGGHALPGDHVDVVLTRNLTPEDSRRDMMSDVVIQNSRVLGIDLNADPTSNKPETPTTATLEVSVADAQKLALAADLGILSLVLRPSGATAIEPVSPVKARDLLRHGAPAAGDGRVRPARRSSPRPARIIVVEGA